MPIGSFTLSGTVDFEVLGRGSDTDTGTWDTEITLLSLTGALPIGGTLTATLGSSPSTGTTTIEELARKEFLITSFFDVFMDLSLPPLSTSVGPIPVEAVGVPEPAAWAMMLLGFAGLRAAWRRRARAALT
jgi:hypothetical protein